MVVTLRKRGRTLETPANPKHGEENPSSKDDERGVSGYEKCRDERIKENLKRMHNLGIFDLSNKLKSESLPPKRPYKKTQERKSPLLNPLPPRRSSRYIYLHMSSLHSFFFDMVFFPSLFCNVGFCF